MRLLSSSLGMTALGICLSGCGGYTGLQLAMPAGHEAEARASYSGVLGLTEEPKPANLAKRGGVCFSGGSLWLHLGVDPDFRAATKAHPAFQV